MHALASWLEDVHLRPHGQRRVLPRTCQLSPADATATRAPLQENFGTVTLPPLTAAHWRNSIGKQSVLRG